MKKKSEDMILILNSRNLEKKSKLRSFFEKNKVTYVFHFMKIINQTLSTIASQFFRENKIQISQQIINLIVKELAVTDKI